MYRIGLALAVVASFAQLSSAQNCLNGVCSLSRATVNSNEFNLAPGEILVAVNGVPVNQTQKGPIYQVAESVGSVVVGTVRAVGGTITGISSRVVNRDQMAFDHAQREAQILANRRGSGHPLGVAPGCSYSGTGTSFSSESPNHCYKDLPESRLVARAVAVGPDGKFYWSAHYR
jgi:hypothetical protein